jgi:hypothetical protein
VSFVRLAERSILRPCGGPVRMLAVGRLLVALLFLTTLGWGASASGEIITNLLPVAGVSGVSFDSVSYSMADINAAGGILIGDKLFDSFIVTPSASANAVAPTAANIRITAVQINGDYGFKVNGLWMASGGQSVDTTIQFHAALTAAAVAQGHGIVGVNLVVTAVAGSNTTGGVASISENVYPEFPGFGEPSLADMFTYYASQTNKSLRDTSSFAPVTDLWVVKDVGVSGGGGTGGAIAISEFYQTFHQAPEPSAMVLLGIGVVGFGGVAWRKQR